MNIPFAGISDCRPVVIRELCENWEAAGTSAATTCKTLRSVACYDTERYIRMRRSATVMRRGVAGAFIASVFLGAVATTIALPMASAAPCTASGLSTTASGVLASAGTYLAAHPDADDVLTKAGSQPTDEAKANVQNYFFAHPGEFLDLKGIAAPLTDLRAQCGVSVSPGQLAALIESFQ